jgi:hypothetical protein
VSTLVYLTAKNCHLCGDGRAIVARLADAIGASVRELDWDDVEAETLRARGGALFPPALYADDRLLGFGRLSERRLRTLVRTVPA